MERKTNKKFDEYRYKFAMENYDKISLYVEKGYKDKLKTIATDVGLSVNAWINTAIREKIERDVTKNAPEKPE